MVNPAFGLTVTQVDKEPRAAVAADLSTIGLVVTAPDADPVRFPLTTPVEINSSDDTAITDLGNSGSVYGQINLIDSQLSGFAASARVIIVRVEEGVDDAATMVNLIEGVKALEDSPGLPPRLIGVPGYTHQQTSPTTANPVVAELPSTLEKLVAHAVVTGPHTTLQDFTDWRGTFSSQRLIPVETWVKIGVNADVVDSVGAVLGMMVARDNANRGLPFFSAANRAMQGIVDVNRSIPFSLVDGASEGQEILALNGGIIVRGEAGSSTAIGSAGFTLIATDTASADSLWRFYNVSRGRDYIHLTFIQTLREFLGKRNITISTVEAIVNTMKRFLRDLQAEEAILGYQVLFEPDKNDPLNIRAGRIRIRFDAEEAPVLVRVDIDSYRYLPAIDALVDQLQSLAA